MSRKIFQKFPNTRFIDLFSSLKNEYNGRIICSLPRKKPVRKLTGHSYIQIVRILIAPSMFAVSRGLSVSITV